MIWYYDSYKLQTKQYCQNWFLQCLLKVCLSKWLRWLLNLIFSLFFVKATSLNRGLFSSKRMIIADKTKFLTFSSVLCLSLNFRNRIDNSTFTVLTHISWDKRAELLINCQVVLPFSWRVLSPILLPTRKWKKVWMEKRKKLIKKIRKGEERRVLQEVGGGRCAETETERKSHILNGVALEVEV